MHSFITNHFDPGKKRPKIVTRQCVLQEPSEQWQFAHHPRLIWFKGKFYAVFTTGQVNEDDVGQHIRLCVSEDFESWSKPMKLVDAYAGEKREGFTSPAGLYTDGETLVCYYQCFEYMDEAIKPNGLRGFDLHKRNHRGNYCITTKDGVTWSDPIQLVDGVGANHNPIVLSNGRLICGGRKNAHTDNPDGIHDWVTGEAYPEGYPQNKPFEDGEGVFTASGVVTDHKVGLCEPSILELDDGTLWQLYRSGTPWLWACYSKDFGDTWSLPEPTKFSDNRTKFQLGRLPSGKYFCLGTPDPFPPRTRHILVLSLSRDGFDFDQQLIVDDTQYKQVFPGLDKNGIYGYPASIIRDGVMYLIVSICKEKIISIQFPIETL